MSMLPLNTPITMSKCKIAYGKAGAFTNVTTVITGKVTPFNDNGVDSVRLTCDMTKNGKNYKTQVEVLKQDLHVHNTDFVANYVNQLGTESTDQIFTPILIEEKTDEEVHNDIKEKFDVLEIMTKAIIDGHVRAMAVSGSPGSGKTYNVDKLLSHKEKHSPSFKYTLMKGTVSAPALYMTFWENRENDCVVVFDDCDAAFGDIDTLNILKAAMDTSKKKDYLLQQVKFFFGSE
jgi:hypothetical protein